LYGLSLNISDIDPSFTIGEMEMQRREIIKKLKEDGDLERNSQIGFAQLVQRIAVVSSSKAAGYGDFCNELLHNEYGYHFNVTLFNATMQGSDAEESIISALEQIYDNHTEFDAIVIIRGGGSKSDLICFDSYPLAQMIAYAPLAVISGIGHERDESIADMVAAVALKTPTAVARFLIDYSLEKENQLDEIAEYVKDIITQEIKSQEERLSIFTLNIERILSMSVKEQSVYFAKSEERIKNIVQNIIKQRVTALDSTADRALNAATQLIDKNSLMLSTTLEEAERVALKMLSDASNKLEMQRLQNEAFNPQHIFEMGYTFAKLKGKVLRSTKDAKVGDTIDIKLKDGALEANITNINNG
ncbi:MAG: exodeoxyribonuclease VII large subunit, partial [Rikenellaceae bacterium]